MTGLKQRFLGLCVPPVLLCLLDNALTLAGQSAEYWAGNYASVNEGSPTFYQLLQVHPAAFAAGGALWIAIFVAGILLLPDTLALIVSIAVTCGHTLGAASWIIWHFQFSYQVCNGLVLLSAVLLGVSIRWGWRAVPEQRYRLRGLFLWGRWGLVALLFGVGVYLFLWPRSTPDTNMSGEEDARQTAGATVTTDRELEQLERKSELTRLCISGPEITDAGMAHIRAFPQLQSLILRNVRFTGDGLAPLRSLGRLKCVTLRNVDLRDNALKHLSGLSQIESLFLEGPQVTNAWLEQIQGLTQLQMLSIEDAKVTDAGLRHVETLTRLRNLNLAGTMVGDEGLRHLRGLSELRGLYLDQTKITDAGLEHLHWLTRLESLLLFFTNTTPQGRKEFQQAMPKCKVIR